MPDNRRVRSNGGVANPSVGELEEAVRRLKVENGDNQDGSAFSYPDRPGEPDCIYYLRTGQCGYGSNCRFNHPASTGQGGKYGGELPERVGQPDCVYYLKTGTCKYGSTCKYHHPPDRHGAGPVSFNILGLPMRQEEKPCPFYMRTGHCKFGAACKFHHPEPASAGTFFPVSGTAIYGTSGSSFVPSSGPPAIGGIPAWPLAKVPYVSGLPVQGLQNYAPFILPPPQSITPATGWTTYLGCMSPSSSIAASGSDLGYYKNMVESGSSSSVHLLSSTVYPPERPDKPECRNFMSTGNCKYGLDCKYHHPRERAVQLATNTLGPLGLPMRPGQAVCSYYSLYGLCKYGPTCKFDHPLAGYSYNHSLSLPTLSVVDPSFFPYQMNSPMVYPSETSPTKLSKLPHWSQKPEVANGKDQSPVAETPENSSELSGSPTNALSASSEPQQDKSD